MAGANKPEARKEPSLARGTDSGAQKASGPGPVGQLMGGFQEQMEKMLSEAADAVVAEKASSLLNEMRASLQEEAKRVFVAESASQSSQLIDKSLKQLEKAGQESAQARHAEWIKKIEADLQQSMAKLEMRQKELEKSSETVTASAIDRLETVLEASRKGAVDRIVTRMKEQAGPVIDQALKVMADLTQREEELGKLSQQFIEKSSVQIEEICTRLDKQFEMIVQARLDSAREDLERTSNAVTKQALQSLRGSADQQETEAQARFQEALAPVAENALKSLNEKASEISREFGGEMANYCRSHLEFVGSAISDLAKGIGKLSKD